MNAEKWHHSEIRIAINDESQSSIAKNLRFDELLYYTFIIHSAGERTFKIGEHLAKLRAKSLTVSYTPFALHFCPLRCRSRQISWITSVLQTETVINRGCVNRQINVSIKKYQTAIDQFWLIDWQTDAVSDLPSADHVIILPRQLFFVAAVVSSGSWDFFIWPM